VKYASRIFAVYNSELILGSACVSSAYYWKSLFISPYNGSNIQQYSNNL